MSLEITGRLIQKLPMQSGTSARGSWQKQEFIIETEDQYPRKICANLWGDKADMLNRFNEGDRIRMSFEIESREFNGRWYTDVKAWRLDVPMDASAGMPQPAAYGQTGYNPAGMPPHTAYVPQNAPAATYASPTASAAADSLPDLAAPTDTFTDDSNTDDLPF